MKKMVKKKTNKLYNIIHLILIMCSLVTLGMIISVLRIDPTQKYHFNTLLILLLYIIILFSNLKTD